jgi:hypothetical protein
MAISSKTLFRGAATTTVTTTLYTVPASTKAIVTNIAVVNTAGTAATYTLSMGTAASPTALATTVAIPANTTVFIDMRQALATTEVIKGGASAVTVSFHISGVEIV